MHPHIEHMAGFLYGTALSDVVLSHEGKEMANTGCEVRFRHLGLTPEMALENAETAELSEDDCDGIAAYADSGSGLWDRDLSLLDGVGQVRAGSARPGRAAQPADHGP
jgi:hypothetical protein